MRWMNGIMTFMDVIAVGTCLPMNSLEPLVSAYVYSSTNATQSDVQRPNRSLSFALCSAYVANLPMNSLCAQSFLTRSLIVMLWLVTIERYYSSCAETNGASKDT